MSYPPSTFDKWLRKSQTLGSIWMIGWLSYLKSVGKESLDEFMICAKKLMAAKVVKTTD